MNTRNTSPDDARPAGDSPLKINVRGSRASGRPIGHSARLAAGVLDITLGSSLGALTASLLTHPLSPLGAITRHFLLMLPPSGVIQAMPGLALLGAILTALLPRTGLPIPSAGRAILGFEGRNYLAGGGSASRWLSCLGATLALVALGSAVSSGRAFQVQVQPLANLTPPAGLNANLNWSELPLFQLAGRWPIRMATPAGGEPEVARVSMGYAEGIIPNRYLPSVTFDWEKMGIELRVEGPRTRGDTSAFIESLQNRGSSDASDLRSCDANCLLQLTKEWAALESKLGRTRIQSATLHPWKSPFLKGVTLEFETADTLVLRALPLLKDGAIQPITWLVRKNQTPVGLMEPSLKLFTELLANLGLQESLALSRAFVDGRIERVNLKDLLGDRGGVKDLEKALKTPQNQQELRARKDILQGIQHLLIAKLTLEPSLPEVYLHLAGTSYLLWKHAVALRDSGTSHSARRVILTARKYLVDFKEQGAAQLRQINQIWDEIEKIEKK